MRVEEFNALPLSEREKSENWPRTEAGRINLVGANLIGANLYGADLRGANLDEANLLAAKLIRANLLRASLIAANLIRANLRKANLSGARLSLANLDEARGLIKLMGVIPGNYYFKCIGAALENEGYQYRIGLNELREGEVFAADERELCSFPGFHFSSKSWADREYGYREYLAKIRIPEDAQINEPWATDGKASADKIEIVQVWRGDVDVTEELRSIKTDGRGRLL